MLRFDSYRSILFNLKLKVMRKHFVWVLVITLFTTSISFTSCSKKESKEIIDESATISVEGVKIATLSDDGNIAIDYSEATVIQKFNEKYKGFRLDRIEMDDSDKTALDSKITLSLFAYDSVKKENTTYEIITIQKVLDENKKVVYLLHTNENLDLFED